MADLKISQLAALASADLAAGDLLPVVDLSASETKKITVTDFTGKAVTLIADATIPGAKILFGASQVPGAALVDSGVSTAKLADDAITAAKLADESTVDLVTTLPASGAFVGQLALDTDDLKVYCWNGSSWQSIKAAGSINTVNGDSSGIVNITVTTSGDTVTIATTLDNTAAAGQFLAGPTAAAGAVSYRTIAAGDLPTASTTAKGAVQVNGNGLSMTGDTIQIANTITANTSAYHVVQYTSKGLVSAGRTIQSGDLPLAGASAVGAVYPGTGLSVAVDGQLNHTNSVTPGTFPKVTYNAQGHVTAGAALSASDIPSLDASKITTGSLISDVLGAKTVTSAKLADYSTVKFGGASSTNGIVTFPVPEFTGQLFFDSSNGDLYLYDGNTWQPVTVISGDLIYAGTYNAATNTVKSVTTAGSAAGLVIGAALPAGSAARNRYYVVVSDSGNGVSPAPITALAPPDMLVCNGSTWDLVDVSNAIAGQIASNISFTPYGGLASTNVQTALQELDDEKLAKAGGIVTGNLEIGTTGSLTFEGATADGFETTLTVVDPTADRTISLPNSTGTLITTGDTGVVTSTMIADGTIVNGDISASAAIVDTKLATISTAGKVSNSATTATNANTASAIVARDASGNFTAGTITASLTGAASLNVLKAGDTMTGALGITAGTAAAPGAFFSGDTNTGIYSPAADQVAISTNGTGRLFVDEAGDVGIGRSSPLYPLHVEKNQEDLLALVNTSIATYRFQVKTDASLALVQNSTERLRTDSSGRLLVGTSTNTNNVRFAQNLALVTTGAGNLGGLSLTNYGSTGTGASSIIDFNRSNGSADGSLTLVSSGGRLGGIAFRGADGSAFIDSAFIEAYVDGAPGLNDMPGRLVFSTTADGAATPTERMRITSDGKVGIGSTSPSARLDVIGDAYIGNGTADSFIAVNTSGSDTANGNLIFRGGGVGNPSAYLRYERTTQSLVYLLGNFGSPTERLRIDSSGRLLVGTSTARANILGFIPSTQFESSGQYITSITSNVNGAAGGVLLLSKSRGGSTGGTTIVQSDDELGQVGFSGADGSGLIYGAAIQAFVDGTPGLNDMPGRLVFSTTADGAASLTERLRITSTGNVGIATSSPYRTQTIRGTGELLQFDLNSITNGTYAAITWNAGNVDLGSSAQSAEIRGYREGGTAWGALSFHTRDTSNTSKERARIDSSGRLLVGTSTARATYLNNTASALFQIEVAGDGTGEIALTRNASTTSGALIILAKSKGTTAGSHTLVSSGDQLGWLSFQGADGADLVEGASIQAYVDGTPGTNDLPGRLVFSTTADGAASPTERLRISQNGRITVANSSLGTPSAIGNTSGTITLDLATANHFSLTLNANATNTLANPSNQTAGQSGAIVITQDATGSRTLAYGSNWKFPGGTAPTLTTTANAVDVLVYYVESATRITARLISDVK